MDMGRVVIDVTYGQLAMWPHDKVEVFDVYRSLELTTIFEKVPSMTLVDVGSKLPHISIKYPIWKDHRIFMKSSFGETCFY